MYIRLKRTNKEAWRTSLKSFLAYKQGDVITDRRNVKIVPNTFELFSLCLQPISTSSMFDLSKFQKVKFNCHNQWNGLSFGICFKRSKIKIKHSHSYSIFCVYSLCCSNRIYHVYSFLISILLYILAWFI